MLQPVLILGAEARVAVTLARSLHRHRIPVYVGSLSQHERRVSSKAITKFIQLPSPANAPEDFINALHHLITAEGFDMLIPATDTALSAVGQYYDELRSLLHVACPPPHILERVLDKRLTLKIAKDCGIPVPETYIIPNAGELQSLRTALRFPMIAKPFDKRRGVDFKIRNFREFQELETAFEESVGSFGESNFFQEYYPGHGVGIEVLLHRGEPIAIFQHRRLKEHPISGGVSVLAVSEAINPELAAKALRLLQALEWEGIAMVEFRDNPTESVTVLMEVNGRYFGSVSLSYLAGIDFPFYEWQLAHDQKVEPPPGYEVGVRWRWTSGAMLRLRDLFVGVQPNRQENPAVLNELSGFAIDLLPPNKDAIWSVHDPVPALNEMGHVIADLLISGIKAIIRKLISESLLRQINIYRYLSPAVRRTYIKHQLMRVFRANTDCPANMLQNVRSILFVCHGNVIRSPMAEVLLREELMELGCSKVFVSSAGLHARPGGCADARAIEAARQFDVSLENHIATRVTQDLIGKVDLVFAMDFLNEAKLVAQFPKASDKIFLLGMFGRQSYSGPIEITDPYHGSFSDVRLCYQTLSSCIQELAIELNGGVRMKKALSESSSPA